jgi:hypothetical protein
MRGTAIEIFEKEMEKLGYKTKTGEGKTYWFARHLTIFLDRADKNGLHFTIDFYNRSSYVNSQFKYVLSSFELENAKYPNEIAKKFVIKMMNESLILEKVTLEKMMASDDEGETE